MISMHRFILGITDPTIKVDHKDHNGLNNTKKNIRACTGTQNRANSETARTNKSGFKGVSWHSGKWRVSICRNGQDECVGYFSDIRAAAMAYDKKARSYFGEFAWTNFPSQKADK